ncbi:MAG: hypothetical protein MK213_05590 [Planctomycetes bacterium]|nr:hypothetical protein [Planctomycetota bacterium]
MLSLAATALALLPAALPTPQEPSLKELLDTELRWFRLAQYEDGSYGSRVTTAEVLVAMALSPRAYREDDGPFIHRGVAWLIDQSHKEREPQADAATAFALRSLNATRYAELIASLEQRAGAEACKAFATPAPGDPVRILVGLSANAGPSVRAEACARAALLYRQKSKVTAALDPAEVRTSEQRGLQYLLEARAKSGLWEFFGQPEPGISALCLRALLSSSDPAMRAEGAKGLDYLVTLQQEDGSIHAGRLPVYVTSVAIMALAAGGRDEDQAVIERGAEFLRIVQADGSEGYSESDRPFGGIGYGNDLRPDLSNLQYALQALKDSGASADDPAFERALVFLQRSQNRSESNPETFTRIGTDEVVRAGNDGGATYMPGDSPAGYITLADGSLVARSYGSMTYALLKCYIFAGLTKEDSRVQAALSWISKHWTLEVNPGFDSLRDPRAAFQGLFYYYLSLSEALGAAEVEVIQGASGETHNWRNELQVKLLSLQQEDGSWVNAHAERWWEGNPVLCTAYALCALQGTVP